MRVISDPSTETLLQQIVSSLPQGLADNFRIIFCTPNSGKYFPYLNLMPFII